MDLTGSPQLSRNIWSLPQVFDLANLWREIVRWAFTLTRPVASLTLSQGTSFSISTIFNVVQPGLYRLNFYLTTKTTGSGGTCLVTAGWSDGFNTHTFSSSTIDLTSAGSLQQGSVVMFCGGQSIVTILTTVAGASGSPVYNLYVALEAVPLL